MRGAAATATRGSSEARGVSPVKFRARAASANRSTGSLRGRRTVAGSAMTSSAVVESVTGIAAGAIAIGAVITVSSETCATGSWGTGTAGASTVVRRRVRCCATTATGSARLACLEARRVEGATAAGAAISEGSASRDCITVCESPLRS